jgi:hypothetical protein
MYQRKYFRAVVQYIHRRSLHTSATQTYKEFMANYYHPRAQKMAKEICKECIICTQSRNEAKRDIIIGRERTIKPEKPREGVSADILYFPKSSKGYTHGLLVADLFSLYIYSFYPMKSKNSAEVANCFRTYLQRKGYQKASTQIRTKVSEGTLKHCCAHTESATSLATSTHRRRRGYIQEHTG